MPTRAASNEYLANDEMAELPKEVKRLDREIKSEKRSLLVFIILSLPFIVITGFLTVAVYQQLLMDLSLYYSSYSPRPETGLWKHLIRCQSLLSFMICSVQFITVIVGIVVVWRRARHMEIILVATQFLLIFMSFGWMLTGFRFFLLALFNLVPVGFYLFGAQLQIRNIGL